MSPVERSRVLVVEDSVTVRKRLVEFLASDPDLEVVGEAGDGRVAVELCRSLRPHVVTMDMMLPVMSGLAATEVIMAYCPTPIVIVSSSTNRGELFRTYDALVAGALDVMEKPGGEDLDGPWAAKLRSTVKMAARIKVITHPRARLGRRAPPVPSPAPPGPAPECRVVAVGASTGGPRALLDVLGPLPADYPLPILVVMHLGSPFAAAFADWLDAQVPLPVRYAHDGESLPPPGRPGVLLAPPDRHLLVARGRLKLDDGPERHSCRPSVDVLFESLAREMGSSVAAALLTGMGRDGAEGLAAIRRAAGWTIAQDEESCVVFGMPRAAIELGAAECVLPPGEISAELGRLVARRP